MIRKAELSDIDAIIDLFKAEFSGSIWQELGQYDEAISRAYLVHIIENSYTIVYDNGSVIGLGSVNTWYQHHNRPMAVISQFLVSRSYRGKDIYHNIMDNLIKYADEMNCIAIFTNNSTIVNEKRDRIFGRFLSRFGFKRFSTMYGRL